MADSERDQFDSFFEIRESAIHGFGVFVKRDVSSGIRLIEYRGERINKRESLQRCEQNNHFIFGLDENHDLDGNVNWNPARFINHSCVPNCEAESIDGRIWIISRREIRSGEELTFNYGYDLEDYRDHACHCGAPECVGFIVAQEFSEIIRSRHRKGDGVALSGITG